MDFGRVSGWSRDKHMYMVWHHLKLINLKLILLCNFVEYFLQSFLHGSIQNAFSIFRNPDNVVLNFIYSMACSFEHHAYIIPEISIFGSAFLPTLKGGVSSRHFL